jgi:hypothetical protein
MYTTGPDEPRNPNPHPIHTKGARLGREITELCGYLFAGTYRLLVLIREFDEERYWHGPGLCSCAHWLNFQCGIGMNAAREKVRVAHALAKLPRISAPFARGEISYYATVLPAIDERHEDAWIKARLSDLDIDEETCVPQWYAGDRMDWDLGIWHLFQLEERAARQPQRLS